MISRKIRRNNYHMNKSFTLTLLCACLNVTYAFSEKKDSIVNETHQIAGVTVLAKRIDPTITSGKPIQIMDKEELELLGLTNLADAVKRFAGTNVKDYGGIGGMKTVSIRNLGSHHTAISYDGVTISNTQAGQIDIGRYSLDNVQSISLAVGESDDITQTARHLASAGVLYINTERPHFDFGRDYSFRVRIKGGSFGLVNPSFRYWQKLCDSTSLSVNADYMRADGMYPFTLINGKNITKEKRYNSDIYTWRGEANLYHSIYNGEINVKAYWFYSERGLPGSVILYNNDANERLWDEDFFTQANIKKQINEKWEFSGSLKYTHTWNKYVDVNVKYQGGKDIDINRQNEYYASATFCWKPLKNISVSLAQDFAYNNLHSNEQDAAQPQRYSSLTALTAKYTINRLNIYAGAIGTFITEDVKSGDRPDNRKRISPTVSISYRVLNSEALYIRGMLKNTFRVPTFNDMYYYQIGTRNLVPEKANEYNFGITWQGKLFKFIKYMSVTIDGYYNDIEDKIVAYPTMYVWKMANFGKVRMYGLNTTFATEITMTNNISITLTVAYSLQNCIDVTDKNTLYYKTQIPYTPKNTGNGSILIHSPWINVGYTLTGCGERYSIQQNTSEYRLNSYYEHNINLSREFKMNKCRLFLQATLSNLTNEQYEIIKYYPMPGRSLSVTGTFTF